jgi:hypothetical protein
LKNWFKQLVAGFVPTQKVSERMQLIKLVPSASQDFEAILARCDIRRDIRHLKMKARLLQTVRELLRKGYSGQSLLIDGKKNEMVNGSARIEKALAAGLEKAQI